MTPDLTLLLGHYMSDGLYLHAEPDDPADCWLTFNDSEVTETFRVSVSEYPLLPKKGCDDKGCHILKNRTKYRRNKKRN